MGYKNNVQGIFAIAVSFLLISLLILLLVNLSPSAGKDTFSFLPFFKTPSQALPFIFILSLILFAIAFTNTDIALMILIFSMLLSPELKLADMPQRAVVVRIDDILLGVVFLGWLAKMAVHKELGLLRQTPLNLLIVGYIVVCIISTALGIVSAQVQAPKSFFYILKYLQYFALYFMVTNNIRDKGQVKMFITAFLITGFIVCLYGISQIGGVLRTSAPFEGAHPEPNTLGGYFLLLFGLCMGIFLYSRSPRWKISSGLLAALVIPPFVFTLSRSSYLSLIPLYLTFIVFSRRKKLFLILTLALVVFIGPIILPKAAQTITARMEHTFMGRATYRALDKEVSLETSAAARVESWKRVFGQWTKRPFLGYGVTGVGLVDAQYPRVLGETGIIGFSIFIWLLLTIFWRSLSVFRSVEDDWYKGISLGFLAGFVGLLVHAFAANTFIIVRIMEPFWFLAAIVMVLPSLESLRQKPIEGQ